MTTVDVLKVVGGFADSVYYGRRGPTGYFIGAGETEPAAGAAAGSCMEQLIGVQDFPFEIADPEMPNQPGDGGVIARFIHRPTELPGNTMQFGAADLTFAALAQSLKVVTVAGGKGVLVGPYSPTYRDLVFLAVAPAQSQDALTYGSGTWEANIWFNTKAFPKLRGSYNTGALPTYNVNMVANYASAFPWGELLVAATHGDVKGIGWYFTWPYRPILQAFKMDGTETDFELAHPLAEDSDDNIAVWLNGTALTKVTVGTPTAAEYKVVPGVGGAADVVQVAAGLTSGDWLEVLYGWS